MASLSLYRKYRPQTFADLVGQAHIKKTLQRQIIRGKVAHAYLFAGPRGSGKTTTARLLAKAVNCQKLKVDEPCNHCWSCRQITEGKATDLVEIDAASNRGIDEIRELREKIRFVPTASRFKIYIIDEVHMLTKEAFNALLKTLEEPPAHAIFILATTESFRIPPTIISRCQRFDFFRATIEQIVEYLKKIIQEEHLKIQKGAVDLIASVAEGSFRDAASILDQVSTYKQEISRPDVEEILGISHSQISINFLSNLFLGRGRENFELIEKLVNTGQDVGYFIHRLVSLCRAILKFLLVGDEKLLPVDFPKEASEMVKGKLTAAHMLDVVQFFIAGSQAVKNSRDPSLPIELANAKIINYLEKFTDTDVSYAKPPPKSEEGPRVKSLPLTPVTWLKVIEILKPKNSSLSALLKDAQPQGIVDGKIVLAVKFKFHAERICERQKLAMISQAVEEVMGQSYGIICRVDPGAFKTKSNNPGNHHLVSDALEVFGE